ncbi:pts system, glucose-specific IIA component [Salmonella enterica subsp. arizonae]|uniref:PTS system glucose-specific EIIA component n=11 Tax=Enterobacteriaceae TaxID=543 RepID=A0A379T911_SALER|nr:pts system, glucose-specific IIA component [Salmonella enterica subsp. arizonae]
MPKKSLVMVSLSNQPVTKWSPLLTVPSAKIFETNHAFSIESDSGIELFVHFGIDTVELKGEGFKRIAEEGQRVKVGDPVIEFDLPLLEEKAKSTLTPVVISNMDEIKELIKLSGSVTVGETPVIRIKKVILAAVKNGADWRHFFIRWPDKRSPSGHCRMATQASYPAYDFRPHGLQR